IDLYRCRVSNVAGAPGPISQRLAGIQRARVPGTHGAGTPLAGHPYHGQRFGAVTGLADTVGDLQFGGSVAGRNAILERRLSDVQLPTRVGGFTNAPA